MGDFSAVASQGVGEGFRIEHGLLQFPKQAFHLRCDVHGLPQAGEINPLCRVDIAVLHRAEMQSDAKDQTGRLQSG